MGWFFLLISCSLHMQGCSGYSVTGGPGKTVTPSLMLTSLKPSELVHVNSLLIYPLVAEGNLRSIDKRELKLWHEDLFGLARSALGIELTAMDKILNAAGSAEKTFQLEQAISTARKLGADSILITTLNGLVERIGSGVGASQPASVSFNMSLYAVQDSSLVWSINFIQRDQALSENLFKIEQQWQKGGPPRWSSARELLNTGFKQACQDLASRRNESFGVGKS